MNKFLLAGAAAVSAFLAPVAANATVLVPVYDAFGGFTFTHAAPIATGSFTDTVQFTALTNGTFTGSISSNNYITFTSLTVAPISGAVINTLPPASFGGITVPNVIAGNTYTLTVNGNNTNTKANYTGNFTLTAVPEPATWAMMLAGFGLVGYAMRRRSVTFARVAG